MIQNDRCLARNIELAFLAKAHLRLAEDHDDVLSIAGSESFSNTLYYFVHLEVSRVIQSCSPMKAGPA